mgnify:CR=1 FL=1
MVISVHGGAWGAYDRTSGKLYDEALAEEGYLVVAIDFRQSPDYQHPDGSADVTAAVRWVRLNADSLGANPDQIGLIGSSSGGHLALLAAVRPNDQSHLGTPIRGESDDFTAHDEIDASVDYVVAMWPVSSPITRYRYAQRAGIDQLVSLTERYFSDENGKFEYKFPVTSTFTSGTYAAIAKTLNNNSEATIFGIGSAPTDKIVVLLDQLNFQTTADLTLRVVGPLLSTLNIQIIDSGDKIKVTETLTTNSAGNGQITLDLNGYKSGVYRAVVSYANIEDIAKFSVGLQTGTGVITLSPTKSTYQSGEEIVVIGQTANTNAILFLSLINPNGDKVSEIELFSDKNGQFTTKVLRIPLDASPGVWTIEANSRLDTASATIDVEI